MIARLLIAVAAGLVGAGIVHIVGVLAVPTLSPTDPYSRIVALGEPGRFHPLPVDDPFARAVACAMPLGDARRVVAENAFPVELGFWSAAVFAQDGTAIYSLNDRTAIDGLLDLIVATPERVGRLRGELDQNAPELVAVPGDAAVAVLRTHVSDPGLVPLADAFLGSASCEPLVVGQE